MIGPYFFTNVLVFVVGLAVLITVCFWPRQKGKRIFIAFIAVTFVAAPLFQFVVMFFFWGAMRRRSYRNDFDDLLISVLENVSPLMTVASVTLLLIYAVLRCQVARSGENGAEVDVANFPVLDLGPRWETETTYKDRVSIARRREWAFLIDFSPVFLWVLAISTRATIQNEFAAPIGNFLMGLSFLSIPFVVVYWVLKDSVRGVSIGKWMTGCRVVNRQSGVPIGPANSFLRNAIFLIPLAPLLELVVASFRSDRRRIGDLVTDTTVVMGPPRWIDGQEVVLDPQERKAQGPLVPHPLDD